MKQFEKVNKIAKELYRSTGQQNSVGENYDRIRRAITICEDQMRSFPASCRAILCKNLAVYYFDLNLYSQGKLPTFLLKAYSNLSEATYFQNEKGKEWIEGLGQLAIQRWQAWKPALLSYNRKDRLQLYEKLVELLKHQTLSKFRLMVLDEFSRSLFMEGLLLQQNEKRFTEANYVYQIALRKLRQAIRLNDQFSLFSADQLQVRIADLRYHCLRCESLMKYTKLIQEKHRLINEDPAILYEYIWDLIDRFIDLGHTLKDSDSLLQLKIWTDVGQIYYRIIRHNERAARYLQLSTNIVSLLASQQTSEDVQRCISLMNLIRNDTVKLQSTGYQKIEKENYELVQKLLAQLPKGIKFFAQRLVNAVQVGKEMDLDKLLLFCKDDRKVVLQLINYYHPDKQPGCAQTHSQKIQKAKRRGVTAFLTGLLKQIKKAK